MSIQVIGLDLNGAKDLREKLARIREDVRGQLLVQAVTEGAEPITAAARAKAAVLKTPRDGRIKGLMRYLIKAWLGVNKRAGRVTMQVGVDLRELARHLPPATRKKGDAPDFLYPLYQEYGTKKDPAQPFLRPALDAARDAAVARVVAVLRRGLAKYEERAG